jgi:hypothetical protein
VYLDARDELDWPQQKRFNSMWDTVPNIEKNVIIQCALVALIMDPTCQKYHSMTIDRATIIIELSDCAAGRLLLPWLKSYGPMIGATSI